MREAVGVDLDRVWVLEAEEQRRFVVEHPRSAAPTPPVHSSFFGSWSADRTSGITATLQISPTRSASRWLRVIRAWPRAF